MVRRAETTERTRDAILAAASEVFWADPTADFTLDQVARAAGVTVQTVIRHFGSREGVFDAAVEREFAQVADERDPAAATTPAAAARQLVAHYERVGDSAMRLLAEEHRSPTIAGLLSAARAVHRDWCQQAFADALGATGPGDRPRRLAQLVAVCDLYTWYLLRRQAGLDPAETELAMVELLSPLLEVP
jgi:AcrR family transcriptional regulator